MAQGGKNQKPLMKNGKRLKTVNYAKDILLISTLQICISNFTVIICKIVNEV